MSVSAQRNIAENEPYPHLAAAPIVEAVIHWQARAERVWKPEDLGTALSQRLPDYPQIELQHAIQVAFEAHLNDAEPVKANRQTGWYGFRLSSADKLNIVQFNRDGIVFSRLRPYQEWDVFAAEGRRLWRIFAELATPSQVQRLGVRFVNRIASATLGKLTECLQEPPTRLAALELNSFLYQSTFDVPSRELGVNVIKAMQPGELGKEAETGLIIDIDVFTKRPIACDEKSFDDLLPKMRQLKNTVFFGLLTPNAIATFKGNTTC